MSVAMLWRATRRRVRELLVALRNRLLVNPRFQAVSARFPLTRGIARRHAAEVFDLCAGFVYSQILFTCVRLQIFDLLAEQPLSFAELKSRSGLSSASLRCLLDGAIALRLIEALDDDRYTMGAHGAIVQANPGIAAMVEHHALLYQDLADPVTLLRDHDMPTRVSRYWAYVRNPQARGLAPHEVADYSALMSLSQPLVAEQVLATYSFAHHRCVLDVGGGEGAFLLAVARHAPHLRFMLFDLPGVAARARLRIGEAGQGDNIHVVDGDFFNDPLPIGADLVTLIRVIHDHDDAAVLNILRSIRRCLPDNGVLLLAEPMASTPSAQRVGAAYFGFYLMAMRSGQPRTPAALCALLATAGFERQTVLSPPMPLQTLLIVAHARK